MIVQMPKKVKKYDVTFLEHESNLILFMVLKIEKLI